MVKEIFKTKFSVGEVSSEMSLNDLGLDSLDYIEFIVHLEQAGVNVSFEELVTCSTVRDLEELVNKQQN